MEIDQIYTDFANALSDIELYRMSIKDSAEEEFRRFSEYAERSAQKPGEFPVFQSSQSMFYYDALTGTATPFGYRETTPDDKLKLIIKQKNKQYGWLLVEAYEEFEDYIERVYAYIGKNEPSSWFMDDFGRIHMNEVTEKSFDWYLAAVKTKYGQNPKRILNHLRRLYRELGDIEVDNALNINLRVAIELIENLRHQIVHAGGRVADLERFSQRVLENSGLWNNGNPKADMVEFIEGYFREESESHYVSLLEVSAVPREFPLNIYHDVCGHLIEYLMAYAVQVAHCVTGRPVENSK